MSAAPLEQRYARRERAAVVAEILLDLLEQETAAQGLGFEERCAAAIRLVALVFNNYPGLSGDVFAPNVAARTAAEVLLVALERRHLAARLGEGAGDGGEEGTQS